MAFEWVRSLNKGFLHRIVHGYDAGFFRELGPETYWRDWQPRRLTVIVVDDAVQHAEVILKLLNILGPRASDLRHPVRLLFVEQSIPESLKKLDEEARYYRYRYRSTPLFLPPLGPTHLQQLAQSLSWKRTSP